jgi:hypothetical protein
MSRFSLDPPDDDAYDVRYDGTDCADCGRPSVAWLCETCSDQREAWAEATEMRMTSGFASSNEKQKQEAAAVSDGFVRLSATTGQTDQQPLVEQARWSVDVALVPVSTHAGVVEVALVPTGSVRVLTAADARELKRMARAFLAADLSNVKDVA